MLGLALGRCRWTEEGSAVHTSPPDGRFGERDAVGQRALHLEEPQGEPLRVGQRVEVADITARTVPLLPGMVPKLRTSGQGMYLVRSILRMVRPVSSMVSTFGRAALTKQSPPSTVRMTQKMVR